MLYSFLRSCHVLQPKHLSTYRSLSTSTNRFLDATDISPVSRKAIAEMLGDDATMTDIQASTLTPALKGKDILARARTGTGKTLAFLVPALQNLKGNANVEVLCVSPTRELATQISKQAEKMLAHHGKKPQVLTLFGGSRKPNKDTALFRQHKPSVLVCTPGRLMAHLEAQTLGANPLKHLQVLVLDEADQLLDHGFRKEIMSLLDRHIHQTTQQSSKGGATNRPQTLLFSATMPKGLRSVMSKAMRSDYTTIDCIGDDSEGGGGSAGATHAHDQVQQNHIVTEGNIIQSSFDVLRTILNHAKHNKQGESPPKVMVFLPTANLTKFYASVWSKLNEDGMHPRHSSYSCFEMHSRKSQSQRSKISKAFFDCSTGIMFSSDVSARGVDYPDVTHVVQIGAPSNTEQYVHRLGRTGRAGKKGQGVLILTPFEEHFIQQLNKKGIASTPSVGNDDVDVYASNKQERQHLDDMLMFAAKRSMKKDRSGSTPGNSFAADKAYQSMLGNAMGMSVPKGYKRPSKLEYIQHANEFAISAGYNFGVMPELMARTVGKMGLKDHHAALNVVKGEYKKQNPLPKKKKKKQRS